MERYVKIENGKVVQEFEWGPGILTWPGLWVKSNTLQIGDNYVESNV